MEVFGPVKRSTVLWAPNNDVNKRTVYLQRYQDMRTLNLALCICIILGSCTDTDSNCSNEEFNLIGSWRLVEFCFSPGDSSCPIRVPDVEEIIELRLDSTYIYSIGSQSSSGSYLISDNIISFLSAQENPEFGDRFLNPINSCRLELNPFCIEECRALFEKVY